MTILEATVEIVKASLNSGGSCTANSSYVLADETYRKNLLIGIEELYKKLDTLNADKLKK